MEFSMKSFFLAVLCVFICTDALMGQVKSASFSNPFTSEGVWVKGNIHTHTRNSDGADYPVDLFTEYSARGYNFVSVTDHDVFYDLSRVSKDLVSLHGAELNVRDSAGIESAHVVVVGSARLISNYAIPFRWNQKPMLNYLQQIDQDDSGLAIVAHPQYWWQPNLLRVSETATGIEVMNGLLGMDYINYDLQGLDRGFKWFLFAADDAHTRANYGRCWLWVKVPEVTESAILSALKHGNFYSSSGPRFADLHITLEKIWGTCSAVQKVIFYSSHGSIDSLVAPAHQSLTQFACRTDWSNLYYVVALVDGEGHRAYSNPIWLLERVPPVIEVVSKPVKSIHVGDDYEYRPAVRKPDNERIYLTLTSGPSWMSVDAEHAALVGKPTATDIGQHQVVVEIHDAFESSTTQEFFVTVAQAEKGGTDAIPGNLKVYGSYPNPFNNSAKIRYHTEGEGNLRLEVFNVLGQNVLSQSTGRESGSDGELDVRLDAPSGVYFYMLTFLPSRDEGQQSIRGRLLMLK
jgi:hypothetical protein